MLYGAVGRVGIRGLVGGFSPASLFADGEQGVWYDPSDFSTMFQDSVGTTPVTAVEQPVGLVLDKSKGLTLSAELVTNGDFSSGTGWSGPISGASITGGALVFDGVTVIAAGQVVTGNTPTASIVAGRTYLVTYTIIGGTSSGVSVGVGANLGTSRTAAGTYSEYLVASTTGAPSVYTRGTNAVRTGSIDNISVKELPGNHATQATSASRPVLSAKVNTFLNSRLNNGVSGSPGTAPTSWSYANAGTPAYTYGTDSEANGSTVTIVQDTTQRSILRQSVALLASITYIVSAVVDVTTAGQIQQHITATSLPAGATITYQLNGSTVSGTTAIPTGRNTIAVVIAVSTTAGTPEIRIGAGLQSAGVAASLVFRQVQIQSGSVRTTYQWTNTSSNYDTTGFPLYLRFDGTDDFLLTGTITAGTDKVQVFSGIRKLSDAARAIAAEFNTGAASSGNWGLNAPNTAAANYAMRSIGTIASSAESAASFASPITNVVTGLSDISGDAVTLRVNATQVAQSTSDQGTGNFLAFPIYLGSRAGTSFRLNGNIYSLIARFGTNLDATTVSNTEAWVNGKTMAY